MFDVTKNLFHVANSVFSWPVCVCVCVCVWESCLRRRLEVVPALLLEQRILGPAFVFEKTMNGCLKSRCGVEVGGVQGQRQFLLAFGGSDQWKI